MAARKVTYRVDGLKELNEALMALPKATQKNVMRRIAKQAVEPTIKLARQLVPVFSGALRTSLTISTRLSKRQAAIARRESKSEVEVYAGASALPHAHLVEFGTVKMSAQPFMRPAWDHGKLIALKIVTEETWKEIAKAMKRFEAKARSLARKKAA